MLSLVIGVATASRLEGVVMMGALETDVAVVVLAVNGVVIAAVVDVIDDVRATFTGMGRITCTHLYINRC